ncbi:YceI family protein [Algoriphagus sp. C2-6-M1]|uniref:YceI family protein n=1 Tax=Algoriphagus persicinus TaxID=3108754 RepID=UPI002B390BD1|nr:YceI family protein [Algoriphagus sp. C2-6-M1]MEB2778927.1 YceI family protein [Algoriphagus sp. C2-6-M1]
MNELLASIIGFLMIGCIDSSDSKTFASIGDPISNQEADTLEIDLFKSKIFWKGTKMMGLGKHEGEIAIHEGYVLIDNKQLAGGELFVDMNSITVTDIPATDPIPIQNLTNHLKSADFFYVDKYPFSTFKIVEIKKNRNGEIGINGELKIKGITNTVSLAITEYENGYTATLEIDRFDWDIAYSGSWIDRTLVDRVIELKIEIAYD